MSLPRLRVTHRRIVPRPAGVVCTWRSGSVPAHRYHGPNVSPVSLDILVVCTANICRSPAAARSLRAGLKNQGVPGEHVTVTSAGVHALEGMPMCEVSETEVDARLVGLPVDTTAIHSSRPLTPQLADDASLILTADRQHRREILLSSPRLRDRVFTLRQAARLASWLVSDDGSLPVAISRSAGGQIELDPLDPRFGVPPFPNSVGARLHWFVAELDAARGLARGGNHDEWPQWDIDDIGDPHAEGHHMHPAAAEAAVTAALEIATAIGVIYQSE